jgi:enoyl ACP reductase
MVPAPAPMVSTMPGLLAGKRILVTGVLTDDSLAYAVAELAQKEGAEIVLTGAGRGLSLTRRVARHLPDPPEVFELDVTVPEHLEDVRAQLQEQWGALDGLLHSIGFAPASCLGGGFLEAGWEDVKVALEVSAYSLKHLAAGFRPLMQAAGGGSVVGLDFDATVAWPGYDWMGVAKAALESTCRYLARDLGPDHIRVNLVAAGPVRTMAAKSIPGFALFEDAWDGRAPLGWSVTDRDPVARACVALLSDWFPATTGEMLHVDGGFHAMGV